MSGLTCPNCGLLNHVGLMHQCDSPDLAERMRRASRGYRADQRASATVNGSFNAAYAATASMSYTVIPEPPRDTSPIRVVAHVGRPVLEITAGQDVIEGELEP